MKKGKVKIILFIILIILLIFVWPIMKIIDLKRVEEKKQPIFCIKRESVMDGGSTEWYGLGYKIIDIDTASGYQSVKIALWQDNISDFYENKQEDNENIFITIPRKISFKVSKKSIDGDTIYTILNKAEQNIDANNESEAIVILIVGDSEYRIVNKNKQYYVINESNKGYKLTSSEESNLKNIINKYEKYYGNGYIIRNTISTIIIILVIILIIKY